LKEIAVFLILFMLFMWAFAIGLFQIYHPYAGEMKKEHGSIIRQEEAFDRYTCFAQICIAIFISSVFVI